MPGRTLEWLQPFATTDPEFVYGWEARGIWDALKAGLLVRDKLIHTENVAQCCLMARQLGYRVLFSDVPGRSDYQLAAFHSLAPWSNPPPMDPLFRWIDHFCVHDDLTMETLTSLLQAWAIHFREDGPPTVLEVGPMDEEPARRLVSIACNHASSDSDVNVVAHRWSLAVVVNPKIDRYGWGIR